MTHSNFYSDEFKEMAVQKLLSGSMGLNGTSRNIGVPATTLFGWKKKYVNKQPMKIENKIKKATDWSAKQKLQAVIETSSMAENELGSYLRKHGLHSSNIEDWRETAVGAFKPVGRPKKDSEVFELRKEKKELQRNLNRKDKALAEMSARVVLLKKSHEIFGDNEEGE